MADRQQVDLLIDGGLVVTMDDQRRVIEAGAVAIDGGRIVAVGKSADLAASYRAGRTIDATDRIVMPGLVDAHVHIGPEHLVRSSFRGDPGHEWIFKWALPIYSIVTPEEERLAAQLSCIEMIRNGTTTFGEGGTVIDMDAVAAAVGAGGQRAVLAPWCWDAPRGTDALKESAERCLDKTETAMRKFNSVEGSWVSVAASCVSPGFCSPELSKGLFDLAREYGTTFHFHHGGSRIPVDDYARNQGHRPLERFAELGLLAPNTRMTHMVHLDEREISVIAASGASITFCPQTSLRLAYGATQAGQLPELLSAGVGISLGTDGVNSSDNQDMFKALQLVVGLYADAREDTSVMSAETALEMATLGGARSLGLEDEIGSLEAGKSGDVILINRLRPELTPLTDVANALVHACDGRHVETVIVAGDVIMDRGTMVTMDEERTYREANALSKGFIERSGLPIRRQWAIT